MSLLVKKQHILLAGIFVSFFAIILWSFLSRLSLTETKYNFTGDKDHIILKPEKPLTQNFIAKKDGLTDIKVAIENASLSYGNSILFELADQSCQRTIASSRYDSFSPKPNPFYTFSFPRILDSKKKPYCFKATYFHRKGAGLDQPFITAMQHEVFKDSSYTNAATGETHFGQSLKIDPAYTSKSVSKTVSNLEQRMSQYKPWFFKNEVLIGVIMIFLAITLLTTVCLLVL